MSHHDHHDRADHHHDDHAPAWKHDGVRVVPGNPGMYYWGGIAGTTFFVDPVEELFAILMIQAPNQREYYRPLFRDMVYAMIVE